MPKRHPSPCPQRTGTAIDDPRLDSAVGALAGVGPSTAERLRHLRIRSVRDLLFHLPSRYQDRTRIVPIGTLRPGAETLVQGKIASAQVHLGRRRSLLLRIDDRTGSIMLRFFHFNQRQQQYLAPGRTVRCFGEARFGPRSLELVHPDYEIVDPEAIVPVAATLTPVYPTTEGLHQASWRRLTDQALRIMRDDASIRSDPLDALLAEYEVNRAPLPALAAALEFVHRPPPDAPVPALRERRHATQKRLCLDELLAHHLSRRRARARMQREPAPPIGADDTLRQRLLAALPFTLTRAQQRVIAEIDADLHAPHPMLRLLQGDVGAGKTIVAAAVAARVLATDRQVALMAPTELLAEQHYRTLSNWFAPLGVALVWLSGRLTAKQRTAALRTVQESPRCLIVGTHAMYQQDVAYRRLGLIIIDEQHRFGVDQRLALRDKGKNADGTPHQLIMTATPIPRSLAMTAYADLDLSVIDELPPNRSPVNTVILQNNRRPAVVERIAVACRERRQVYWVCPLIDESDNLACQSAIDTAAQLTAALPGVGIGLVHGQMKPRDKDRVMQDFIAHRLDLLVATTVIEVGVDVANASLMIIENAERLGLAQLHQLRGRVGRGSTASDCVLLYQAPLSELARARLQILRETNDGFVIAERDLELRGPGELLGTRQTGVADYRIADPVADSDLLPLISAIADRLADDPAAGDRLIERWLGASLEYGAV